MTAFSVENFTKVFRVRPGTKCNLKELDPGFRGGRSELDKAKAQALTDVAVEKIRHLQGLLSAEKKHSLLLVFQGMDASGKDGAIRHLMSAFNPQACSVHAFKQPTEEEAQHDFLWRVHRRAPARGEVVLFNRSHYEDVLVVRVHESVPKALWSSRYDRIAQFEALLAEQNNTTILKFFLHLSPQEQLERFRKRLTDPTRNWKISETDYTDRDLWKQYTKAYEEALQKTSTEQAPWFVIPADYKWFRNLAISEIVVATLEAMRLKERPPEVDLEEIRRKYHEEVREQQTEKRRK